MKDSRNDIVSKIQLLKQTAKELSQDVDDVPALARNAARILASVKMLELNFTDVIDLERADDDYICGQLKERPK
ncbi:MAG: hypothetical protein JSW47_02065 [Phycisphaerales bacterium]|nr:MAG: hypothetical protein JSW47_02065 [Phycisphaerales bacterium]UCF13905.1 MAG: hypothetical protein JSW59_10870 [Phycisphaerales bacterium]